MKKLLLGVAAASALGLLLAGCQLFPASSSDHAPAGLTVEYRENPCGLDAAAPRLGWKVGQRSGETNVVQTAYQVLVASSP